MLGILMNKIWWMYVVMSIGPGLKVNLGSM
jgi:hypothetical protein